MLKDVLKGSLKGGIVPDHQEKFLTLPALAYRITVMSIDDYDEFKSALTNRFDLVFDSKNKPFASAPLHTLCPHDSRDFQDVRFILPLSFAHTDAVAVCAQLQTESAVALAHTFLESCYDEGSKFDLQKIDLGVQLGVDIENPKRFAPLARSYQLVAQQFFDADFNQALNKSLVQKTERETALMFAQAWTRLEASVKATGQGLQCYKDYARAYSPKRAQADLHSHLQTSTVVVAGQDEDPTLNLHPLVVSLATSGEIASVEVCNLLLEDKSTHLA